MKHKFEFCKKRFVFDSKLSQLTCTSDKNSATLSLPIWKRKTVPRREFDNTTTFGPIKKVEIHPVNNCNLKCDYCYLGNNWNNSKMSEGTALSTADFIAKHARNGTEVLSAAASL